MVLEAVLLLALLMVLPFAGLTNIPFLVLYVVVLALCLPVIRLIMQAGPPFVPTPKKTVQDMMKLAAIKPGDIVYDLGCGDGRLLIAAAEKGAVAIGYELSMPTYLLARFRTFGRTNISVRYGDFWKKDLSDADVIVCYLLMQKMKIFEETIWLRLKPGARVVSHSFTLPNIKPTAKEGDGVLYVK
jgi:SAM-dependent methyltransferase